MSTVALYADRIIIMIAEDITSGAVPLGVRSFTELHDHVDANDYLSQAGVPFGTDADAGRDGAETVNAVCAEVTRRLGN